MPNITNRFLIGGQWVAASNTDVFDVVDSSTEEVIETVGLAGTADIDAAVSAARRAFDQSDWRSTTPGERADMLQRLSEALVARSSDIATMVSRENGNPISTSTMIQAAAPAGAAGYFAQITREFPFDEQRTAFMGNPLLVTREPVGVAAAIVPGTCPSRSPC